MVMNLNKTEFIKTLSCKTGLSIKDTEIINKILEDNFFVSKKNKDKIITIPNGYDEKVFYKEEYNKKEILKELNINKNYEKIVCFAGRLAKNKGVDFLLEAAKTYEKDNILTLIVGDGEEFTNLNNIKQKLALKNVVFLGILSRITTFLAIPSPSLRAVMV